MRTGTRRAARWLDEWLEPAVMVPLYAVLALIIGGEALRRYVSGAQTQWGGTVAIQIFICVSWVGCAYHVRRRSHLRFDALRKRLPPGARALGQAVDDVLWLVLAAIVIHYSVKFVQLQHRLGSMLEGTDAFPLWIATACVPAAWGLIAARAVQSLVLAIRAGLTGAPAADRGGAALVSSTARE